MVHVLLRELHKLKMTTTLIFLIICATISSISGWIQWDYSTQWADGTAIDASNKETAWKFVWHTAVDGTPSHANAPRPRRGHSMVLYTDTQQATGGTLGGNTYIVMFGGRDLDGKAEHIPKTYNVEKVNGTLSFTTYDQKPVSACFDYEGKFYTPQQRANCAGTTSKIDVGTVYNDVWAYKLCDDATSADPHRWFDGPCEDSGWVNWHPGALQGGCLIQLGIEVCNVPSERYNHAAVVFNDGCMYVYGGFSQRCQDYCDDIWFFDVYLKSWRQIYRAGDLGHLYAENLTYLLYPKPYSYAEVPVDNFTTYSGKGNAGPAMRWRHTMEIGQPYLEKNEWYQKFYLFGGHRLWQGYSAENSEANSWSNYTTRPLGGYLKDMWVYTKLLDFTTVPGKTFKANNGLWQIIRPKERCHQQKGIAWVDRNAIACSTLWPTERAGHGSAYDDTRGYLWIYGGYNTYFPYLSTDGVGAGPGVSSSSGGFVPYPGYEYYRSDLWYYNFHDGYWYEIAPPPGSPVPLGRMDMVFLLLGDIIFMHGGFSDDNYLDDTWYFNISTNLWLQKTKFVYPIYPGNCSDDFAYIASKQNNCTHLLWPKHLDRSSHAPFDILQYAEQDFYWPDPHFGPYWSIQKKDYDSAALHRHTVKFTDYPQSGTPEFPYAATGPLQYAKKFFYSFNMTHNATLLESCTSVFGQPTRNRLLDGMAGRSNVDIFISQPRPQKPGWDGCRDRYDQRKDLPFQLQYIQPLARASHRAIFHKEKNEILMYGGLGYLQEQPFNLKDSYPITTMNDMWYFNLFHCVNNCSLHGDCYYGFCMCYVGYYGEDCSNSSCPGTSCWYDPITHEQSCLHACQAGYMHHDSDIYVQDIAKIPCTETKQGESNGICDGFGTTQCAPPYVGNDCSTKDCVANCSFNGWCSIEYPVSRCMCMPGYFGEICEHMTCLNNCSYPNGVCNTTTGGCTCRMTYSPFNNTREFHPWAGEDCSFLFAYEGSPSWSHHFSLWTTVMSVLVIVCITALLTNADYELQPSHAAATSGAS